VLRGIGTLSKQLPSLKNELKSLPMLPQFPWVIFFQSPSMEPNEMVIRSGSMAEKILIWLHRANLGNRSDYLSTFGLHLNKGRNFDPTRATDSSSAIINQKLADELHLKNPIGAKITNGNTWTVIGVVDDFIFESLKDKGYAGLCMTLRGNPSLLSVKVKPQHLKETLADITGVWDKFAPNQQINYSFLDEGFEALYQDVERTKNIFTCFALVAIFVAALGLFGLATYVTQQRTKEIGVRKVLGANAIRLLRLLSGDFIKLVFVALVIATPVAWWAMNQWLTDFNYRIEINWLYFILAGMSAILIALGTISYQT
jgi:putative ABC transport system permease protein